MNFEQEYFYISQNDDNNTELYDIIPTNTEVPPNTLGGSLVQKDKNTVTLTLNNLGEGVNAWFNTDNEDRYIAYTITDPVNNIELAKSDKAIFQINANKTYTKDIGLTNFSTITNKVKITAKIYYPEVTPIDSKEVSFTEIIDFDRVAPKDYSITSFWIAKDGLTVSFALTGLTVSESGKLQVKWIIKDKKDGKVEGSEALGISSETNADKSGIEIKDLAVGPLRLQVMVIDTMKNEGKWTPEKTVYKETEVKDVQTDIFGLGKLFKIKGLIPGQKDGDKNFKIIMISWAVMVLIVCILGADFPFPLLEKYSPFQGWITNTIAVYRLSFWNVGITFFILFLGFLGYLYWLGKCSTYDVKDTKKQTAVDDATKAFFKPFEPESVIIVTMIAGFLMALLPAILVFGTSWKSGGNWRNHMMLLGFSIACAFFIGRGFIAKYIDFKNCEKVYKDEGKVDPFVVNLGEVVTFCLFFCGSSLSGSFFVHYFIRTFLSIFSSYRSAAKLPKFAQGWTGLVMSLVTMFRNTFYSIFIIIANIFGGLSFFTSN